MSGFYPISPLIGIPNTSYGAQAGVMNSKWAVRVCRGKKVLAEKTMNELELDNIVGIIFGHIRLEGLSRHSVAMCAGRLMQFARQYQLSGVCPNYEVPDLQYDGEAPVKSNGETVSVVQNNAVSSASTTTIPSTTTSSAVTATPTESAAKSAVSRLESPPKVVLPSLKDQWNNSLESQAVFLSEMATYGATLPEGHLDLMFRQAADYLVRKWSASGSPEDVVRGFASMILSSSPDSQVPPTGNATLCIDVGRCMLVKHAREYEVDGHHVPANYPCAFHMMVADLVSRQSALRISIETSSTGCRVTIS